MSLINDALKRAGDSQRKRAAESPLSAPLQPVDTLPRRTSLPVYFLPVILFCVVAVAVVFVVVGLKSLSDQPDSLAAIPPAVFQEPPAPSASPAQPGTGQAPANPDPAPALPEAPPPPRALQSPPPPAPVVTATDPPLEPASSKSDPGVPQGGIAIQTNLVTRPVVPVAPVAPPTPAPAPRPEAEFPELKLQGIFYRPSNPSVLINGRTLFLNDRLEQLKVVEIERTRVVVENADGVQKELFLY